MLYLVPHNCVSCHEKNWIIFYFPNMDMGLAIVLNEWKSTGYNNTKENGYFIYVGCIRLILSIKRAKWAMEKVQTWIVRTEIKCGVQIRCYHYEYGYNRWSIMEYNTLLLKKKCIFIIAIIYFYSCSIYKVTDFIYICEHHGVD